MTSLQCKWCYPHFTDKKERLRLWEVKWFSSKSRSMWQNSTNPSRFWIHEVCWVPSTYRPLHVHFPLRGTFSPFAKLTPASLCHLSLVITSSGKLFLASPTPQPRSRLGAHPVCRRGILQAYPSLSAFTGLCVSASGLSHGAGTTSNPLSIPSILLVQTHDFLRIQNIWILFLYLKILCDNFLIYWKKCIILSSTVKTQCLPCDCNSPMRGIS